MDANSWVQYLVNGDRDPAARSSIRASYIEGTVPHDLLRVSRSFWRSVPVGVFSETLVDITPSAQEMARCVFSSPTTDQERSVKTILKRLRKYVLTGRPRSHRGLLTTLLEEQRYRCASCAYRFVDSDMSAEDFVDDPWSEHQTAGLNPPQVDHIIPVFVGPNRRSNFQVLCRRCNSSKGGAIVWFLRPSFLRPIGPSELLSPTNTLLWMARERDGACTRCGVTPIEVNGEGNLLEVVRESMDFGWLLENVRTLCTVCRAQGQ
jgi:hypothetical protein